MLDGHPWSQTILPFTSPARMPEESVKPVDLPMSTRAQRNETEARILASRAVLQLSALHPYTLPSLRKAS